MTRLATNARLPIPDHPAGTPAPSPATAVAPRRPTLYLVSHRHPDGTVTTYAAPNNAAGRITRVVSRRTTTSQGVKEDSEERQDQKGQTRLKTQLSLP